MTADPAFLADVLAGLSSVVPAVPARWLYDRRGSELFEAITALPEYYPTRTETAMLERHIGAYGAAPLQAAADGWFASRKNLDRAKACGVRDMAFHKKCGLSIEDMVRSRWVYRKLRNFRAGIEAGISCLKRAYGLARCTWRGLNHFKAYVWSSVVAYNLVVFVRLRPS